jgi:bifunctional non-homologous end joining protein LigD
MESDDPDRYVLNMAKAKRSGRIFLDYLRNDRMATAVAPLSPRARAGAPVSMPLAWSAVKKGLDPNRFTLRTTPKLIAASRAWKEYCDSERPLRTAIEKLSGKGAR